MLSEGRESEKFSPRMCVGGLISIRKLHLYMISLGRETRWTKAVFLSVCVYDETSLMVKMEERKKEIRMDG